MKWTFVAASLTLVIAPVTGWTVFDTPFFYQCSGRSYLTSISSTHNNDYEDRIFEFACTDLPPSVPGTPECSWTEDYVNNFDQPFFFQCSGNRYMTGIDSYHDNTAEDRRFRFRCCQISNTHVHDCSNTGWVNWFDQTWTYHVPDGKVIKGMGSYHDNPSEDRRFMFSYCSITTA